MDIIEKNNKFMFINFTLDEHSECFVSEKEILNILTRNGFEWVKNKDYKKLWIPSKILLEWLINNIGYEIDWIWSIDGYYDKNNEKIPVIPNNKIDWYNNIKFIKPDKRNWTTSSYEELPILTFLNKNHAMYFKLTWWKS